MKTKDEEKEAARKKKEEEKAAAKKSKKEKAATKNREKEMGATNKKKDDDKQRKDEKNVIKKTKADETAENAKDDPKKTETPKKRNSKLSKAIGVISNRFDFKEGKGFFWATADVYRGNPVEYAIFSMRDFVFYFMFMVLVGLISFGDLDYHHNYYGNVVTEVLTNSKFVNYKGKTKTFREIYKIPEIWVFVKEVVLKVTHNAYYENYEEFEGFKVLTESIIVGSIRMRQKRVKNDTCQTAAMFYDVYRSCYDYYSDGVEDKEDFGRGDTLTSSAWTYTKAVEDELSHTAHVSTYGPGGFVMNFPSDANLTSKWLQELEDNLWIRIGARAVFIEFTLYSPNSNLFCTVKLLFEILPSGGVTSNSEIITSKLWHESEWDWFIFGCKFIIIAYAVYFTLEEFTQIIILKERYLSNFWNILDLTIVVVCYSVIITGVNHFKNVETLNAKVHNVFHSEYSSFDTVSRSLATYKLVTALLTFVAWLKLFKFAVLSKTTSFLLSTFNIASYQILTVTLTMVGAVSGFALLGTVVLEDLLQFRSYTNSFFTLFGLFVGGLYFAETNKHALTAVAKIFLGTYIIIVLVIFFPTFTAIIVNGFRNAVFELDDNRTNVYFGDVCNMLTYKISHFWKNREKTADALYQIEAKKLVKQNFDELLELLRRRGCRGMELALLLKKHNVRPGAVIPFETMGRLYNDFLARCQLSVEVEGHTDIWDKLEKIYNTVDFVDLALGDVWIKMDTLANRITVRPPAKDTTSKKKKK